MTGRARSIARSTGCAGLVDGIDNVYFNIKSERHSFYQGLLSLGDRRVADVIERAEQNGGTGEPPSPTSGSTRTPTSTATARRTPFLPWQIIDGGLKTSFFRSELAKSERAEWTLPPKRQRSQDTDFAVASSRQAASSRPPGPLRAPCRRRESDRGADPAMTRP